MQHSKLLQILRTFGKEELRDLGRFVANPGFGFRSEAGSLLKELVPVLLKGREFPEKEQLFRKIFGAGKFDDHRVRVAMSALLHAIEKYLAIQDLMHDEPALRFRLSKVYRERKLKSHSEEAWKEGAAALEKRAWRNAEFHYENYRFQEERYRSILDGPEVEKQDLQQISDDLDAAFISRKLWQSCFLLAHQARYNTPCNFGVLNQILPHVGKYLHFPAVSIYYHCYQTLTEPGNDDHFPSFKKDLLEYGALFPPDELRDLYILAINFCTRRYNEGDHRFLRDQFELYQIGFGQNYFISEGKLSRFTYLNAATIGLVLKEFDWVEAFIDRYKSNLEGQFQESLFSFNMARLAYQKGQFGEALLLLQRSEYKETMLALAAKTMQMKIYFESGEFDLLDSHLQAIAAFIRRKKLLGYHRDNYLNLIHFMRKLMDTALFDKKARQVLHETVRAAKPLAEKEWLLNQIRPEGR